MRIENDYYVTPAWCVDRLIDSVPLSPSRWIDPCVGNGAIVRAVSGRIPDVWWTTCDIRRHQDFNPDIVGDYLSVNLGRYDVCVANPPYKYAIEFVKKAISHCDDVIMLLRINFLASAKRHAFLRANKPDIYVLPQRPSFTGTGSDGTDYAWMRWSKTTDGEITFLDKTSRSERQKKESVPGKS